MISCYVTQIKLRWEIEEDGKWKNIPNIAGSVYNLAVFKY